MELQRSLIERDYRSQTSAGRLCQALQSEPENGPHPRSPGWDWDGIGLGSSEERLPEDGEEGFLPVRIRAHTQFGLRGHDGSYTTGPWRRTTGGCDESITLGMHACMHAYPACDKEG